MLTNEDTGSLILAVVLILVGVPFALWFLSAPHDVQALVLERSYGIAAICAVQPGILFTAKYLADWPNAAEPAPSRTRLTKAGLAILLGILLPLELVTVIFSYIKIS